MSVGYEIWLNNKRYQITCYYNKNKLTFREACFETAKDIRARTNKNLVLTISGGSDSMLVYNIFKDLGIDFKTVHQRYWAPGEVLINEYESSNVDPEIVDVYQDIDVVEFQNSDWLKKIEAYHPTPWFGQLAGYVVDVIDKEDSFIVGGHNNVFDEYGPLVIKDDKGNPMLHPWFGVGTFLQSSVPFKLEGYNYSHFFNDNSTLTYSRYKNCPDFVLRLKKNEAFAYHFPEWDHIEKVLHADFPYFHNYRRGTSYRQEYGMSQGFITAHTWVFYQTVAGYDNDTPTDMLNNFMECLEDGMPITAVGHWNREECSTYSIENIHQFSDQTERYTPTTIPSKEL